MRVRERIARGLRAEIMEGRYRAGERLPTREEIGGRFQASVPTVQKAFDDLTRDGFVQVLRRRDGTVVVPHPPHLHHYRFVINCTRSDTVTPNSPLVLALRGQAERLASERPGTRFTFATVSDVDHPEATRQLMDDVQRQRVAGLIFIFNPFFLINTPIIDAPGIPRVGFTVGDFYPTITDFWFDTRKWMDLALDQLRRAGCKRVGLINVSPFGGGPEMEGFCEAAAQRGLRAERRWIQGVPWTHQWSLRNCTELMMHPDQRERPDGLIISDDSAVDAACQGLMAAGIKPEEVGRSLHIVAHANLPVTTPTPYPMTRMGPDMRELMDQWMRSIEAQRQGKRAKERTAIRIRVARPE